MKRDIARKWVKALKSGEYKQTQGKLRDYDGFCCLGVLCNLHAQAHPEIASQNTSIHSYLDSDTELPLEVQEWAGMYSDEGYFEFEKEIIKTGENQGRKAASLIDLNDDYALSFTDIGNVISRRWKDL